MSQVTVTLDQFVCIHAFDMVAAQCAQQAAFLRAIKKDTAAEKLESNMRHVIKLRDEYARESQSSLVIAQAGAIPNIKGEPGKLTP